LESALNTESQTSNAPGEAGWRARLRDRWEKLKHEKSSPAGIGVSVAMGVLVACTPFYGLQTLVALALAWALRLNKIAVLLGSAVSNPLGAPFLLFGSAQLGEMLWHGHWLPMTVSALWASRRNEGPGLAADLLLGGLVEGLALGAIIGVIVGLLIYRFRQRNPSPSGSAEGKGGNQ
jgi:uncharacterized protein (DUF2062 family)